MPATQVLEKSISIANDAMPLAVLWHLVIGGVLLAAVGGWRPSRRSCDLMLCVPLASVAVIAGAFGMWIDSVVFAALTAVLAVVGWRAGRAPIDPGTDASDFAGGAMLMFGAAYPHFVGVGSPLEYLYAAPIGLLAAPTLALVTGLALFTGDHGGRTWARILVAADVAYGFYGLFYLGVYLDIALILGGAILLATTIHAEQHVAETIAVAAPVEAAAAAMSTR